jgi:hypothetical protein
MQIYTLNCEQSAYVINVTPLYISGLKTPWPESESELYRPSDRRLSAKLVPTFADKGVPRGERDGSLRPLFSDF